MCFSITLASRPIITHFYIFYPLDKKLSTLVKESTVIDVSLLWKNVLNEIKPQVSQGNFIALFKNTSIVSLDENVVTIAAPSIMVIDLLQKRFSEVIKIALDKQAGRSLSLAFVPKMTDSQTEANKGSPLTKADAGPLFSENQATTRLTIGHLPRVRADYTFENFAVSGSNQLAFVSASRVAQHVGISYNPFFIYGPVGVGKTHLMHAIANHVYQKRPEQKIIYITSEEFTNEVVEAIRHNDTAQMKKRFRSAYLLLIDDIQFIEGKERVQEELFHTFNILIDSGSQIALSSDRPPHDIKKLEKRLSSRFAGGLTVDIGPPDFELKTAILLIKAKKYGHELSIDVAKAIAQKAEDTRSLEGLLLRVITEATTRQIPITEALAKQAAGEKPKTTHVHAEDVVESVCNYYRIKPTQIKGPKRDAPIVRARQIAMYLLKNELGLTLVEIGNALGGRDHTTVMYGVEKIGILRTTNSGIDNEIRGITRFFRG